MNTQLRSFPVTYDVETPPGERNRLTCAFRIILAIPHVLLIGGPGGVGWSVAMSSEGTRIGGTALGIIGAAASVVAVISWFAIVFTGRQPRGLWDFTRFYLSWRSKAVAYMALLRDEYPPFGDGSYPISFSIGEFPETRDRVSVGFRLILAIPHFIVIFFIGIAWFFTAVVGWFAILLTGTYPQSLFRFSVGYLRWSLRFEAYLLLIQDAYPPFSLN
jgi:Domain of unknown function (DUF4389)